MNDFYVVDSKGLKFRQVLPLGDSNPFVFNNLQTI